MARMYSRKKGKSGSTKPKLKIATWVKLKTKEQEEIIVKLAKEGKSSAEIGTILRDQYGVPTARLAKLRVAKVMKDAKAYTPVPEDMYNLIKKAANLRLHLDKNKRDYTSKRGMELTESKIRRLGKYYKKKGELPKDWKWNLEQAKLLIK